MAFYRKLDQLNNFEDSQIAPSQDEDSNSLIVPSSQTIGQQAKTLMMAPAGSASPSKDGFSLPFTNQFPFADKSRDVSSKGRAKFGGTSTKGRGAQGGNTSSGSRFHKGNGIFR